MRWSSAVVGPECVLARGAREVSKGTHGGANSPISTAWQTEAWHSWGSVNTDGVVLPPGADGQLRLRAERLVKRPSRRARTRRTQPVHSHTMHLGATYQIQ